MAMKKHLFHVSFQSYSQVKHEDIVELPEDMPDEEVEEEFKEWVWDKLDAYREEV